MPSKANGTGLGGITKHNERCDTLCQEAMTLLELEEDEGYMNTDSVSEQSDTVAQSGEV